ncbi:hypothetical protein OB919_17455 [Halobacteria archaeon AArc-curdl1]|uniref:Uncharacterized protein n=1 Tax=Natronosalvus hydrolyticus TaxID=2979988 RepID=A0AAP3E7D4_9EURY|nr:hypothetical protein [Halobacteria archaeon AArc-curdl1]
MVETAVGFILGAIIGSIATAVGSYLRYWKRERDATRRLRRGLLAELRAYDYLDEFVADGRYEGLTYRVDQPVLYASVAPQLGRLTDREVEVVVTFYSRLRWLEGLEDPEDKSDRIDTLVECRQRALEAVAERIE